MGQIVPQIKHLTPGSIFNKPRGELDFVDS